METDTSLINPDQKIIIDAKFYKEALQSNFETQKIKSNHLYQLFAYLKNDTFQSEIPTKGILL